jgi:hypothetical protein
MAFNLDDYTTVQERSDIFWERYKNGAVRTKIISESDTRVIMVCELFRDSADEKPFATGHAKEVISDRGVNRDFALENCETSSRGVAFKAANIGTEKNGPSREEMARVVKTQTNYSPPGTRARAVENVLRETFSVDNKLDDPVQWAAEGVTIPIAPKPPIVCCNAGHILKTGQTKTTNKPYYGYVCQDSIKEHAVWAKQDATGAWFFPKQEGGE